MAGTAAGARRGADGVGEDGAAGGLPAEIELAEPMGAETNLYLRRGAMPFVARVRSDARQPAGSRVSVTFDLERARIFDARTEAALV